MYKFKSFFKKFKSDDTGTLAVMWAVSLTGIVAAIGMTYDLNKVSNAKQKSQHVADLFALAATTYIRDHNSPPTSNSDGFVHNTRYLLSDFDINLNPYGDSSTLSENPSEEPGFTVQYDTPEEGYLTTTVDGYVSPAVMQIFGKTRVQFHAETVTSYLKEDLKDPASIFFVMDNSGSMDWTDSGSWTSTTENKRIYALKETMKDFMVKMASITQYSDTQYLRTALWAFSSANKTTSEQVCGYEEVTERVWVSTGSSGMGSGRGSGRGNSNSGYYDTQTSTQYVCNYVSIPVTDSDAIFVDTETLPDWGVISEETIDAMTADGGTYPSGALDHAKDYMVHEADEHLNENGSQDPHKFVIFMTDGVVSDSSSSLNQCTAMKNAGVTIFTIGFGITANSTADTFLTNCASPGKKVLAADADVLEETFDTIGEDILEEVIRIRS